MEHYDLSINNSKRTAKFRIYSYEKIDFKYKRKSLEYVYAIKRYVNAYVDDYFYSYMNADGIIEFKFGLLSYVYSKYLDKLSESMTRLFQSYIFTDFRIPDLEGLRDDQIQDLRQLLRFRCGLFQTFTGYGKTEVIAALVNYLKDNIDCNILIVTAGDTAKKELANRLESKYGITFKYFDYESKLNLVNLNGFLRSKFYHKYHEYWSKPCWIIADEVENCVAPTAREFYDRFKDIQRMYGFSATSDKKDAQPIRTKPADGVDDKEVRDILGRNIDLVNYFGTTVVFKRPTDFQIKIINIRSTITKTDIKLDPNYEYNEVIYDLFTNDRICKLIESITYKVGLIFIPMFRLQVIDYWLSHIFLKPGFKVLVISGRGYEVYETGTLIDVIDVNEMKKRVSDGEFGVILGTKSSYNALDLPELTRSFLLYSKTANVVIQAIGRTARKKQFEIYSIVPFKSIPVYSKDLLARKSLIKTYYSECNISELNYNENVYDYN